MSKVRDGHDSIVQIEHEIGLKTNWHPGRDCCSIHQKRLTLDERLETINFDNVTIELTSLLTKMAYSELISNAHVQMLTTLDEISDDIAANVPTNMLTKAQNARCNLRAQNEYARSSLKGVMYRAQYLSKRAEALVQTVR